MRLSLTIAALALLAVAPPCLAQTAFPTPNGSSAAVGTVPMAVNPAGQAVPASSAAPVVVTVVGAGGQQVSGNPIATMQCPANPISKKIPSLC